jgi:Cu(I)/Ag(I) efflux system membrane fusion protein
MKERTSIHEPTLAHAVLLLAAALLVTPGCERTPDGTGAAEPAAPALAAPLHGELRSAFDSYERCRALLAADRLEGLAVDAGHLEQLLRQARAQATAATAGPRLEQAAAAARALATAADLSAARAAFAEVSRSMLALAELDRSLVAGWHAFSCPMVEGFSTWLQPAEAPENPFMGTEMPRCAVPAAWDADATTSAAGEVIAYYTCAMHTSVRARAPGPCPICSMDLTPVTERELASGVILLDAGRRQAIGVRTAAVERRPTRVTIRAVGSVVYDERRLTDVTLKYPAWIGALEAGAPGQRVERGQTLFTVYNPELYAAQEEFLAALVSQRTAQGTSVPKRADYLVDAARQRLRLWDVPEWQIESIAAAGQAQRHLAIASPVAGHVVEKNVVAGAAVEPGARLLRIACATARARVACASSWTTRNTC